MFHYTYITEGTCSRMIELDIDGDKVYNISFTGGCNGNLKALSIVLEGFTINQITERFEGLTCGNRSTSCADQLCKAVKAAYLGQICGSHSNGELDEDTRKEIEFMKNICL